MGRTEVAVNEKRAEDLVQEIRATRKSIDHTIDEIRETTNIRRWARDSIGKNAARYGESIVASCQSAVQSAGHQVRRHPVASATLLLGGAAYALDVDDRLFHVSSSSFTSAANDVDDKNFVSRHPFALALGAGLIGVVAGFSTRHRRESL